MAARLIRRAICAGAKKGAAVAPAAVAARAILPHYVLPLPRSCYKRDLGAYYGHARAILSVRAVLLRRPFAFRSLHYRPLTLRAFDLRLAAARKTSQAGDEYGATAPFSPLSALDIFCLAILHRAEKFRPA